MTRSANPAITIDVPTFIRLCEARVYSDSLGQWFDFESMVFDPEPKKVGTPLTPLPNNPHARSAPFVKLLPGEYRVYAFQLDRSGKPEPDYLSCDTLVIHDETRAAQVINIHVSQ